MDHDTPVPDLVAALAGLPRDAAPPPGAEDRTVRALRRRGLLPRPLWQRYALATSAIAAAVAIFAAGSAYGSHRARGRALEPALERGPANARAAALLVQRAGSDYVDALVGLAAIARTTPPDRALTEGREAARTTLCAAAARIASMAPHEQPGVEPCDATAPTPAATQRVIFWF